MSAPPSTERARSGHYALSEPGVTERLTRRIRTDFADDVDRVRQLLGDVESGKQDRERVLAAAFLGAHGDVQDLGQLIQLSHVDWRSSRRWRTWERRLAKRPKERTRRAAMRPSCRSARDILRLASGLHRAAGPGNMRWFGAERGRA